jgi:hypothetical protein
MDDVFYGKRMKTKEVSEECVLRVSGSAEVYPELCGGV